MRATVTRTDTGHALPAPASRTADALAYWIAVYEQAEPLLCRTHEELVHNIAVEGEFRAGNDVVEVIHRRADGAPVRFERDEVDAWCAERDEEIAAEERHRQSTASWLQWAQAG